MKNHNKIKLEQLTLFDSPKTSEDGLWEAIMALKESHNSVRKKLFQEIDEIKSSLIEAKAQNAKLACALNNSKQYDFCEKFVEI